MTPTVASPSLVPFLAGYLNGDVSDDVMSRFDDLFEDTSASATERLAFARFYLDALASGDGKDAFPGPSEMPGILDVIHA